MKKLYCTKLDRPHEESEHCADGCVAVYLASEVDARIAELEAFIKVLLPSWPDGYEYLSEMSLLQMQQQYIAELEKALRFYAAAQEFRLTDADGVGCSDARYIARKALGL